MPPEPVSADPGWDEDLAWLDRDPERECWQPRARGRRVHRGSGRERAGESRFRADELLGTAGHLDTHLPGTRAALRDGILSLGKARLIAAATSLLDPGEARYPI